MLQQTTVPTVIPRFREWMKKYPSISKLASASERRVLRDWEGLGYYSRARNLLKAAKVIMNVHNGRVPDTFDELNKLPGIGGYTASAILSIAFNKPYPVIDANVKRVMARFLNRKTDGAGFEASVEQALNAGISKDRPGDFNEALMELGQTICVGGQPLCAECPLAAACRGRKAGSQESVLGKRTRKVRLLRTRVLILVDKGRVLVQRSDSKLMQSLWKFPGVAAGTGDTGRRDLFLKGLGLKIAGKSRRLKTQIHSYTIHRETLLPEVFEVSGKTENAGSIRWVTLKDLGRYPMPSVYRRIVEEMTVKPGNGRR